MNNIDIITPPEMEPKETRGNFWKHLGMLVLGTTTSLVLTFGTAQFIEKQQRNKDRRLTALMVMSNIEAFALNAECLRYYNRKNMKAVDISEQELMEFMEKWKQEITIDQPEPNYEDFNIPKINPDSLSTY